MKNQTSITVFIVGKGQRKWCGSTDLFKRLSEEVRILVYRRRLIKYRMWELRVKQTFYRTFPSQSLVSFPNKKKKENAGFVRSTTWLQFRFTQSFTHTVLSYMLNDSLILLSTISLYRAADITSSIGHMMPYSSQPFSWTRGSILWGSNIILFGVTSSTPLTVP